MPYYNGLLPQTNTAISLIRLSRYLLTLADSKGLTHGEKHYLIQTSLHLIHQAEISLSNGAAPLEHHQLDEPDVSDIPF